MNKKKIKLTQVSRHAYPSIGGIEDVIKQITESLPEEEFEQEIITCSKTAKSAIENGVNMKRCKYFYEFASNPISLSFIWELSKVDTDILHYHMPYIFAVIAHFIARPKYKKLSITYHGDIFGYDKYMKIFNKLYEAFLDKVDVIHILSILTPIPEKYKYKCKIIPYGTQLPNEYTANVKLKEKYENKKILFSVGRLARYKGFIYALEAMKQVSDDCILLIAGEGPLKESLQDYIDKNNLKNKVQLLGKISDKELNEYYKTCDIYLFPSIMRSEAFGIVQLEAMRCSTPIINTSLNTGVNYVSINNETGLTVEPENPQKLVDAINLLLNNDELRLNFGQNARKRVEEVFDINKIKPQYVDFYSDLMKD